MLGLESVGELAGYQGPFMNGFKKMMCQFTPGF